MIDLPRVIGHRGAAASAPENTRAGFLAAAGLGVEFVEFDVQLSADGVPVLFHDDLLDRTTDGKGLLVEQPWETLRRLDAGCWFSPAFAGEPIPTLENILAVLAERGLGFNIEIKADDDRGARTARAALDVVQKCWRNEAGLLISSFSKQALAEAKRCHPGWVRGLLVGKPVMADVEAAKALDCVSLHVDADGLNGDIAAGIKRSGLKLLAYTVNDRVQAQRLYDWGVDAVFSDKPEHLLRIIAP